MEEVLYKGKFDSDVYYNLVDIIEDFCIIQTVYPPRPENRIHTYKGNSFSEDSNIIIYKNNSGEIEVHEI